MQHMYAEIEQALAALVAPGTVFELRLLGGNGNNKRVDSGYFDSPANAASAVSALEHPYKGIYFTPNSVLPDLLARSANRITPWAPLTTLDPDIVRRNWLMVDIDPIRPTGISATDEEHELAMERASTISAMMSFEYGWCSPLMTSSGNGAWLYYPINEPNTEEVRDAIALFLKCLRARYSDSRIDIDTTVYNASRISRLPGTWARKGDNVPTRPHRKAEVLRPLAHLNTVTLDRIQIFNARHEHLLANGRITPTATQGFAGRTFEGKYRSLNDHAFRRLAEWVPHFFPTARQYKEGYRVASADLGLSFEEDLTIHPLPLGIKYFGDADQGHDREGKRHPVGLIAEFCENGDVDLSARKLADVLKAPLIEFEPIPQQPQGQPALPGMEMPRPRFDFKQVRTIADLKSRTFKEQKFIIPGVLPTGNMLLSGRPKMRKTWLALQLGMAIARGGKFLEWQCSKGGVLFLGLEDNEKRIRSRINTLDMFQVNPPVLDNFWYWTGGMSENQNGQLYVSDQEEYDRTFSTFPKGEAGVDALDQFCEAHPDLTTIVIDTLQHFKAPSNNRDIYARDYESMMPITKLAARREILIMPVTHEKKGLANADSGDFLEDVTGSAGITGGADGNMSIKGRRGVQEENESRKLMLSGRDVPYDFEIDMSFNAERGGWMPAARVDAKIALRALFDRYPVLNRQDLGHLLINVPPARLTQVLKEMQFNQELVLTKAGYARCP